MRFLDTTKNVCCDDVIRCIFDFNDLDLKVYKKLKEDGETTAQNLAAKLGKERSTIYRSLQKLTKCGICIKKTNYIKTGGHYHSYKNIDSKLFKTKVESCIDNLYKSMKETIKILEIE